MGWICATTDGGCQDVAGPSSPCTGFLFFNGSRSCSDCCYYTDASGISHDCSGCNPSQFGSYGDPTVKRRCCLPPSTGTDDPSCGVCVVTWVGDCRAQSGGTNQTFPLFTWSLLTCPTAPNMLSMAFYPVKHRAFPHRLSFSINVRGGPGGGAARGWTRNVPSDICNLQRGCNRWTDCLNGSGGQWQHTYAQALVDPQCWCSCQRTMVFREFALCCDPADYDGWGIPHLTRRVRLPDGRWNGRLYMDPCMWLPKIDDPETCGKATKLDLYLGYWSTMLSPATTGMPECRDSAGNLLPYSTQSDCTAHGGIWRINFYARPPRWHGMMRAKDQPSGGAVWLTERQMVHVPNMPGANEYDWAMLLPVPPWQQGAPYPQGADQLFPVKDAKTLEIPCMTRDYLGGGGDPYVNRSFKQPAGFYPTGSPFIDTNAVSVPAGITGIVGHSPTPINAYVGAYCAGTDGPWATCPPSSGAGCFYNMCGDAAESIYRKHFGTSAPLRLEWTADPQNRGWWIDYVTHVWWWFAQDGQWLAPHKTQIAPQIGIGTCYRPVEQARWNADYFGKTIATYPAAAAKDSGFVAWVLTHDSGFGLEFQPRYNQDKCCDAFVGYDLDAPIPRRGPQPAPSGQPYYHSTAMGDTIFPPAAMQDSCFGPPPPGGPALSEYPPCQSLVGKYSYWYRPALGAPYPHQGLYHETVRKRFTSPASGFHYTTEYGWARLLFSTGTPVLTAAPPSPGRVGTAGGLSGEGGASQNAAAYAWPWVATTDSDAGSDG